MWLQEHLKLRAIGQFLEDQWQSESGQPSITGTGPPNAMLIDFCIREVHKRIADPDVFMGRWSMVERHLNEVLRDGLRANLKGILEGMGHSVTFAEKKDGTLITTVGPVDGGPPYQINIPPKFYEAGPMSRRKMGIRNEELTVN